MTVIEICLVVSFEYLIHVQEPSVIIGIEYVVFHILIISHQWI